MAYDNLGAVAGNQPHRHMVGATRDDRDRRADMTEPQTGQPSVRIAHLTFPWRGGRQRSDSSPRIRAQAKSFIIIICT